MILNDIILADYARVDPGGKFTVVGAGFTTIHAPNFPHAHPVMFLLLRIVITESDKGTNKLEIVINDSQRNKIFRAEANLDVPSHHRGQREFPMPIQIANLKFENAGLYQVEVMINGRQSTRVQQLDVRQQEVRKK